MPIVFIHGVAVREDGTKFDAWWGELLRDLRSYIAPVITSGSPEDVRILPAYWGNLGARFAWGGASRPRSSLRGKGAAGDVGVWPDTALALTEIPEVLRIVPRPSAAGIAGGGQLVPKGSESPASSTTVPRLKDLTAEQLADLTSAAIRQAADLPLEYPLELLADQSDEQLSELKSRRAELAAIDRAVDLAAHDPDTLRNLAACDTLDAEVSAWKEIVRNAIEKQPAPADGLVAKGVPVWLSTAWDNFTEGVSRASSAPGYLVTKILTEVRKPANDLVTLFFGDVFAYINSRGLTDPDLNIAFRVMDVVEEARRDPSPAEEPLVVLTHSMGGQIAYDLITHFLPRHPQASRLRVDFWCATASQVGLFEEMKLFLASVPQYSIRNGNRVPYPSRQQLGVWWNVWDSNDFISYSASSVFVTHRPNPLTFGVIDEEYQSGMSVVGAHGGYLQRKSFFRLFAQRLKEAKAMNWWRP
jgi:hypothetical protein